MAQVILTLTFNKFIATFTAIKSLQKYFECVVNQNEEAQAQENTKEEIRQSEI